MRRSPDSNSNWKPHRTPDGKPTSEIYECKIVVRALRELYGDTSVAEFGPLALKAARQKWVNEKRSRTECNRRVGMVKRIFKWAASEELAPQSVYHALATVTGLKMGRTVAHETDPIGPVEESVVDAILPFLNRHVRGLFEFQRLTGCRPGGACSIRRCDIETSGAIGMYTPPYHKATRPRISVGRLRATRPTPFHRPHRTGRTGDLRGPAVRPIRSPR